MVLYSCDLSTCLGEASLETHSLHSWAVPVSASLSGRVLRLAVQRLAVQRLSSLTGSHYHITLVIITSFSCIVDCIQVKGSCNHVLIKKERGKNKTN